MSIGMIGLDTAKSVFQVHGVNESGKGRDQVQAATERTDPVLREQEACTVVMEACGAAHHWARVCRVLDTR